MFLLSIQDNFVDVPQQPHASCDVLVKRCEFCVFYSNTAYLNLYVRVAR